MLLGKEIPLDSVPAPCVFIGIIIYPFEARERMPRIVQFGEVVVWRKGHRKVKFWWEWEGDRIKVCRALKRRDVRRWPGC